MSEERATVGATPSARADVIAEVKAIWKLRPPAAIATKARGRERRDIGILEDLVILTARHAERTCRAVVPVKMMSVPRQMCAAAVEQTGAEGHPPRRDPRQLGPKSCYLDRL